MYMKTKLLILTFLVSLLGNYTNAHNYSEKQIILADSILADDEYGTAVAISGDFAVVGMPNDNFDQNGNFELNEAGSALVYKRNANGVWEFFQKIHPHPNLREATEHFGSSVAIYNNTIVVGAPAQNGEGKVLVFNYIPELGTFMQAGYLTANDGDVLNYFGASVDIYDNHIIVGAPSKTNASSIKGGGVYIFMRSSTGSWNQNYSFESPNNMTGGKFGASVAIYGFYAIVGAPNENVSNGITNQSAAGRAYIYKMGNLSTWTYHQKITALVSNIKANASFGYSVDITDKHALIGAPYEQYAGEFAGKAYFQTLNSQGEWDYSMSVNHPNHIGTKFGNSVALTNDFAVIGQEQQDPSYTGSVHFYKKNANGTWAAQGEKKASDATIGDMFGTSVAISNTDVIVGAPSNDISDKMNAGSAYTFFTELLCTPATVPVLSANKTTVCSDEEVALTLSGTLNDNTEWFWYSGTCGGVLEGTGINLKTNVSKTTTFYARGEGYCSEGECASITITVSEGPKTTFNISNPSTCEGTPLSLTLSSAPKYRFEPASVEDYLHKTFTPISGNYTYTVTAFDEYNCAAKPVQVKFTVKENPKEEIIQKNNTLYIDDIGDEYQYQWFVCSKDHKDIIGENSSSYSPTRDGSYGVRIASKNGCVIETNCVDYPIVTGLDDDSNAFGFYPNPVDNTLYLSQVTDWSISTTQGIVLASGTGNTVEMASLTSGVYILKANNKSYSVIKK